MMDHAPLPPRDYCKIPLPTAIDKIARDDPTRTWASLPVDDWDLTQGFEDISYARLAHAINRVAHALDAAFGPRAAPGGATTTTSPPTTPPTLAYVGIPDVRYQIVQVAAVKAGYQVLLPSPLNSTNIHVSLMEQTGCVAVLSAVGVSVDEVLRCRPGMKHATIAELDELLALPASSSSSLSSSSSSSSSSPSTSQEDEDEDDDDDDKNHQKRRQQQRQQQQQQQKQQKVSAAAATQEVTLPPPYPFTKTWDECEQEPYMILHSSGTTAAPKPVVYKHMYYGNAWALIFLPDVHGRAHFHRLTYPGPGTRFLLVTAPWHAMSASCSLQMSVFGGGVLCPGFRHRAMGTGDIGGFLEYADVTVAALTPWMMEDVARKRDAKRFIERLDAVLFGGAVLSPFASEIWSKYTHIQNGWGATEAMATSLLVADPQDHAYVYFDTKHTGIVFRPSPVEFFDPSMKTNNNNNNNNNTPTRLPLFEVVFTMTDETSPYASWHFRQGLTPKTLGHPPPYPEYRIGDLWTPHPDPAKASYVFRFVGRTDDTFTLSSASNIHPGPVEAAIVAHPAVQGVLVVGDGRRQPAALMELVPTPTITTSSSSSSSSSTEHKDEDEDLEDLKDLDLEKLADDIFTTVVQPANANMPAHATLRRTHLALVPAGAFVRTPGLGKIVRRTTVARHAAAIDALYRAHGDQWQAKQGRFNSITATTEIKVEVSESANATTTT